MAKHTGKKTLEDKKTKGRSKSLKDAADEQTLGNFNANPDSKRKKPKASPSKKLKGALYVGRNYGS